MGNSADLQLGQEVMGWDMVMLVVQNVPNVWLDIKKVNMSDNCNTRCCKFSLSGLHSHSM